MVGVFGFRSAKRLIIAVAIATVVFAWAGAAIILSGEYHHVLSERTHGLERMRDMAAEQTRRMILVNDLFLRIAASGHPAPVHTCRSLRTRRLR